MKRIQLFLAGIFIAVGSLVAQEVDWTTSVAKIKELIATNPTQAAQETEQLVKGKNKKNVDLLCAVSEAYLSAGKITEAETYVEMAKKASSKSAKVAVLAGDIFVAKKEPGAACQMYEQAMYFDDKYEIAYIKFADVYKGASYQLAIEKLEQLKAISPESTIADKKLAEIYYRYNKFEQAAEAYSRFINSPQATEDDLVNYSFTLFLVPDFEKSLEIANMGLKRNPRKAAFNRLAMYNYTDLKRYDEATQAANAFFNASDKADFSSLDYKYYGHLLLATKDYNGAINAFKKALEMDPSQMALWILVSNAYEEGKDYVNAIDAFNKYYNSLAADKQTPELQLQLGKMYYSQGNDTDSLAITTEGRKVALAAADSVFAAYATVAPDSYLGSIWRARTNSSLDPETTAGLAKPYYEQAAEILLSKNDPRFNTPLIECYLYLGYYYLVANKIPESKEYWQKILAIDPNNDTAKRALEGIK